MNPVFLLSVKVSKLYPMSSPVTCRNPISPINGSFTGLKKWYLPNDRLPLTCDGDFAPNGNSVFTCQSSGSWSGGQPICARKYVGGRTTVRIASLIIKNTISGWMDYSGDSVLVHERCGVGGWTMISVVSLYYL